MRFAFALLALPLLAQAPAALDFNFFRTKVEPIFHTKREGHARCVVCHTDRNIFRLQPLAEGAKGWTEEESRKNFAMIQKIINRADPEKSTLLMHPLAHAAGGDEFHSGGRQFATKQDPNWQTLLAFIKGAK